MKTLGRRAVLRGAGIALALPALEAMASPRTALPPPKRFVALFTPNGTLHAKWKPEGTERAFTMSPMMAALEPFKHRLVILDGLYQKHANGDGHTDGMGGALTGMPLLPTKDGTGFASGVSVDQVLANAFGMQTRFRSLELNVRRSTPNAWGCLSYAGRNQPIPPQAEPERVFERLFAEPTDTAALAELRRRRQTVADAVRDSHARLRRRLGGADRQKVDAHLSAIRDIERRLAVDAPRAAAATCGRPAPPEASDAFERRARLMTDLLVMALACDQTRVATFMYDHAASRVRPTWLGFEHEHHQAFHDGRYDLVEAMWRWYAGEVAYLLARLDAIPEGDGTMLENALLFWTTEQSDGKRHRHDDMPYLLAGNAGGALKTGRYLRYEGSPPHNDLLVSILNLMGIPAKTFGKPDWCTGPLARLI